MTGVLWKLQIDYDVFTSFHGNSSDLCLFRKFSGGDVKSYGLNISKLVVNSLDF